MDLNKVLDWKALVDKYLQGDDITPVLCRIINPLISIIVTSYIVERFYFKYQWLDLTDYKAILSFIVKGGFVIPGSIFLVVHLSFILSIKIFEFLLEKASIACLPKRISRLLLAPASSNSNILKDSTGEAVSFEEAILILQRLFELDVKLILFFIFYNRIAPNYNLTLLIFMVTILFIFGLCFWLVYMLFKHVPKLLQALYMEKEDASPEPELP